jgi:NAD-dependent deacetylase sirtuin 5
MDSLMIRALKVKPNPAHYALAMMSFNTIRKNIAPNAKFTMITQNVDGLTPLAVRETAENHSQVLNEEDKARPSESIEMHGRIFDVICSNYKVCDWKEWNTTSPICEALRGTEDWIGDEENDAKISIEDLPHCPKCGELARPGVVWFGEMIPALSRIDEIIETADLCLVVGTSSTVGSSLCSFDLTEI